MRESIGYTFTLNIVIVFILIAFAILMAIMSYSKAFKINNRIMNEIEKCEGYNSCAVTEINRILSSYGYSRAETDCPKRDGIEAMGNPDGTNKFEMCVYYSDEIGVNEREKIFNRTVTVDGNEEHKYRYGVLTFYHVDLPIISRFRLPVYTRTNWIYDFEQKLGGD